MTPADARLILAARARRDSTPGAQTAEVVRGLWNAERSDPRIAAALVLLGDEEGPRVYAEAWDAAGQPERRDGSADSRIPQVRAPADEVDRVRLAAKLEGVSLTAFVRSALEERAGRVIGLLG